MNDPDYRPFALGVDRLDPEARDTFRFASQHPINDVLFDLAEPYMNGSPEERAMIIYVFGRLFGFVVSTEAIARVKEGKWTRTVADEMIKEAFARGYVETKAWVEHCLEQHTHDQNLFAKHLSKLFEEMLG